MHISDGVLSNPVCIGGYLVAIGVAATCIKQKMKSDDLPKIAVITSVFFVASLINVPLGPTSVHLILPGLVGITLGAMAFPSIMLGLILQALLFQHGGLTTIGVNTLMMGIPALIVGFIFHQVKGSSSLIVRIGVMAIYVIWGIMLVDISVVFLLYIFNIFFHIYGTSTILELYQSPLAITPRIVISIPTAVFLIMQVKRIKVAPGVGGICGALGTLLAGIMLALLLVTAGENFFGVAKVALAAHLPVIIIESVVTGATVGFLLKVKPDLIGVRLKHDRFSPSVSLDS